MPVVSSTPPPLSLPPLIVGTMARGVDCHDTRTGVFRSAIDHGLRCFDTAPLYGFGTAERWLGEAMAGTPRASLQILGKVGLRWDDGARGDVLFEFDRPDGGRGQVRRDSRPESVLWEVARSLERLGTDYLDLVQIHQPDPRTPIDETLGALRDLQRQGRVRHIGVCNVDARQLRRALRALAPAPLYSVQAPYSLTHRLIESDLLPACRQHQVAVLAYSPLAAGALVRPPVAGDALAPALTNTLLPMAARHGVAPAAVALAWVIGQTGISAAISGVSSSTQLRDQIPAARLRLSDAESTRLSRAFVDAAATAGRPGWRRLAGAALRRLGLDPRRRHRFGAGRRR